MQEHHKPYDGLFITLEGGDGCGKSTLADLLAKELVSKGYQVVKTREPGGTPLSEHLREQLLSRELPIGEKAELLLFLAARVQHIEEVILPSLHEHKVVICERFNDSTVAYQGHARHIGGHVAEELCALACDFLKPDVTLLLDLDPEIGLQRLKHGKKELDFLEQEKLQFHKEVRSAYLHLADKHSKRISIVDASLSSQEVLAYALKALEPFLKLKTYQ